jgi:hypothetical protein
MSEGTQVIQDSGYDADAHSMADLNTPPQVSPEGDAPPAAPPIDWKSALGNDPSLERFNSPDDYVKSFNEAQGMIRSSIRIPSENASKEDMDAFYEKLQKIPGVYRQPNRDDPESVAAYNAMRGVPAEPTGYKFQEIPGLPTDPRADEAFAEVAHKLEMTPEQANGMRQYLGGNVAEVAAMQQKSLEDAMNGLKREWGMAFEQNREQGIRGVAFMDQQIPGFADWIDSGAGADPMVMKLMWKVAELGGEAEGVDIGRPGGAMTPYEARQQIDEIRNNPDHPWHNEQAPGHSEALEKMNQLYVFANPTA